jgi:hypothetical protein
MQGRRVPMKLPSGRDGEGTEVQVEESSERWSEFTLSDGTIVRAKATLLSAVRADDEYDATGNPFYLVNLTPVVSIASSPENLRKKVQ